MRLRPRHFHGRRTTAAFPLVSVLLAMSMGGLLQAPSAATDSVPDDSVGPVSSPRAGDASRVKIHYATKDAWVSGRNTCSIGRTLPRYGHSSFGVACFAMNDDKLNMLDGAGDGFRVGMQWRTPTERGLCVMTGGAGGGTIDPFDATFTGFYACDEELDESERIRFRVGRCDNSVSNCSRIGPWGTWGPWNSRRVGTS